MWSWGKVISGLVGMANTVLGMLRAKSDRDVGAAVQREVTDGATIKVLETVAGPVSGSESERLWDENSAKFGSPAGISSNR